MINVIGPALKKAAIVAVSVATFTQVAEGLNKRNECVAYARMATIAAVDNRRFRCGFTGLRWTISLTEHLNWCLKLTAAYQGWVDAENSARADAMRACKKNQPNKPKPFLPKQQ